MSRLSRHGWPGVWGGLMGQAQDFNPGDWGEPKSEGWFSP